MDGIVDKYGGSIYDYTAGKSWDPGQAVCREEYGINWMHSPAFRAADELDDVPISAIRTAERIIAHEPDWMTDKEADDE